MAISHVQPLLFLLASLFFLPALHAVHFEYCNKSGYDSINVTRVEISPNPIRPNDKDITITVYGYASKSVEQGGVLVDAKFGDAIELLTAYSLCEVDEVCTDFVIKAGANFVLPLRGVPIDVLEPVKGQYKLVVTVSDMEDVIQLCVDFYLPTPAPTLVST